MKRKDFLKLSSASVFLAGLKSHGINPSDLNLNYNYSENNSQYMGDFIAPKLEVVKVAFIGVGARGIGHAKQIATIEGTEIVAISDLHQDLAKKSSDMCKEIGNNERHRNIAIYSGSENKWRKMLKEVKPDAVFISTNWDNHAPKIGRASCRERV